MRITPYMVHAISLRATLIPRPWASSANDYILLLFYIALRRRRQRSNSGVIYAHDAYFTWTLYNRVRIRMCVYCRYNRHIIILYDIYIYTRHTHDVKKIRWLSVPIVCPFFTYCIGCLNTCYVDIQIYRDTRIQWCSQDFFFGMEGLINFYTFTH